MALPKVAVQRNNANEPQKFQISSKWLDRGDRTAVSQIARRRITQHSDQRARKIAAATSS